MVLITYERLVEWQACYLQDGRTELLQRLFAEPVTIRDVLTRCDGEWALVSPVDRLWVATRPGVLPDRVLRLASFDTIERILRDERSAGREPDARSWAAIEGGRRYVVGELTAAVFASVRAAARAAVRAAVQLDNTAAADAARVAAWAADSSATSAAEAVTCYAAYYRNIAAVMVRLDREQAATVAAIVARLDEYEVANAAEHPP